MLIDYEAASNRHIKARQWNRLVRCRSSSKRTFTKNLFAFDFFSLNIWRHDTNHTEATGPTETRPFLQTNNPPHEIKDGMEMEMITSAPL